MIVRNEEAVLARCLDSVSDLMDEIVIVDTGSTDATREIAARYTGAVYDFPWVDDFGQARNFAFSKTSKEYIYSADADEVLDRENRERFRLLKETLPPEIEIVQMKYGNQLQFGAVYNFDEEYRPKLFKRLRRFVWEDPVHEMVRLEPYLYDSDIVITHMPTSSHAGRDLRIFHQETLKKRRLSKRLHNMYARELFLAGTPEDFAQAAAFFEGSAADVSRNGEEVMEASCVAARAARLNKDTFRFFKYACKVIADEGCSEICCEMGAYYEAEEDYEEAIIWYYNAAYETQPILNLRCGTDIALDGLSRCYHMLGMDEQAAVYQREKAKSHI
jgi:glycosyltransferase involved in cell wall biosynthesis